jgi:sigma-B regulation protein RsbU (phosphoserine phosphatase)
MLKLLIAALLEAPLLIAQVITADNCVHQAGDNPDWARPDFDDTRWSKQYPGFGKPYIWTRCRLDLRSFPPTVPIHIAVRRVRALKLFVEGEALGSSGDFRTGYLQLPIPGATAATRGTIIVAMRQFRSPLPFLWAGSQEALRDRRSNDILTRLSEGGPGYLGGGFSLTIGIVLLLLFAFSGDKKQRELLWFGIYCLAFGSLRLRDFLVVAAPDIPNGLLIAWTCLGNIAQDLVIARIFYALAGRQLPAFYFWLSMATAALELRRAGLQFGFIGPSEQSWEWNDLLAPPFIMLLASACAAAFWPLGKVPRPLRLPSILSLLFMLGVWARLVPQLPGLDLRGWSSSGNNVQASLNLAVLVGIFVVIARRHRQVSLDRAELQGEMKAAQEVQRLLTSSTLDAAPWASVDVAYSPAKEVGGDFYFCRQTAEGQLIVVGDVSGKGLRAGMLASAALGALRALETSSPALLPRDLNATLHGQTAGGFVTCCAALLRKEGELIVANAGHPSPYCDGREVAVEAGLPLGVVAGVAYEESVVVGERFTLVSGGVVEAENAQRELFGFDRTRAISTKPAQEIAAAAKAWGQNDDITVVTVRRVA